MSLRRRRAEVAARSAEVQAGRIRSQAQAQALTVRARALWPWLWIGGGIALGTALERDLDRRPRRAGGYSIRWLSALPWGLLIPWIERALASADRRVTARS